MINEAFYKLGVELKVAIGILIISETGDRQVSPCSLEPEIMRIPLS
jgi:hypothetical protein